MCCRKVVWKLSSQEKQDWNTVVNAGFAMNQFLGFVLVLDKMHFEIKMGKNVFDCFFRDYFSKMLILEKLKSRCQVSRMISYSFFHFDLKAPLTRHQIYLIDYKLQQQYPDFSNFFYFVDFLFFKQVNFKEFIIRSFKWEDLKLIWWNQCQSFFNHLEFFGFKLWKKGIIHWTDVK